MGGGNRNSLAPSHIHHDLFFSLWNNKLGAEGGKAIGEALKVNTSITDIK